MQGLLCLGKEIITVLEIRHAKEIAGTVTMPCNPDFFLISLFCACAAQRRTAITPVAETPLITSYKEIASQSLTISQHDTTCLVEPKQEPNTLLSLRSCTDLPYLDFILFLLLGLKKTVAFTDLPPPRLALYEKVAARFGYSLASTQYENTTELSLSSDGAFTIPDGILDINHLHPCLGLAFGLKKQCSVTIDHQFQSPLRHILPVFGYEVTIKSNYEKKGSNPLTKRMRFLAPKLLKKNESKLSFAVSIDFRNTNTDDAAVTLPGDDILAAVLLTAKSLIQRGQLICDNVPLEPWNSATIQYIRKMGCPIGLQEDRQTSFGSTGTMSMQRFTRIGHKMECTPLFHYRRHLPAMVVLATFAKGQSVFRALDALRYDRPDPIEQMLAGVRLLGGRHGEMPDGIVIDGAKQYDGFDVQDSYSAVLNGALAAAGLACNGKTVVNDTAILQRWPDFNKILNSICSYRT